MFISVDWPPKRINPSANSQMHSDIFSHELKKNHQAMMDLPAKLAAEK
jgi:hypothetical protein